MALPDFGVDRGAREAFELLSRELTGAELQSLLLQVFQQRAQSRKPSEVVAQYQRDGFCRPAQGDLRESIEVDRQLLGAAEAFEALVLEALDRLQRVGYAFGKRRVTILATEQRAALGDRVAERFGALASRERLEHPYYSDGLRYQVWVTAPDGTELPLIDGGAFDWLKTLTSNRRAVYVASGAGAQLMPLRFRARATP